MALQKFTNINVFKYYVQCRVVLVDRYSYSTSIMSSIFHKHTPMLNIITPWEELHSDFDNFPRLVIE